MPDPSDCRFCRWWNADGAVTGPERAAATHWVGTCHRHAPIVIENKTGRGSIDTVWPVTEGCQRCGDYNRFRNPDGNPNTETHT